jgi:hypothetical protein
VRNILAQGKTWVFKKEDYKLLVDDVLNLEV